MSLFTLSCCFTVQPRFAYVLDPITKGMVIQRADVLDTSLVSFPSPWVSNLPSAHQGFKKIRNPLTWWSPSSGSKQPLKPWLWRLWSRWEEVRRIFVYMFFVLSIASNSCPACCCPPFRWQRHSGYCCTQWALYSQTGLSSTFILSYDSLSWDPFSNQWFIYSLLLTLPPSFSFFALAPIRDSFSFFHVSFDLAWVIMVSWDTACSLKPINKITCLNVSRLSLFSTLWR
jgi:hypothetical protein